MHVCMYACMHGCMYAYICACVYVYVDACRIGGSFGISVLGSFGIWAFCSFGIWVFHLNYQFRNQSGAVSESVRCGFGIWPGVSKASFGMRFRNLVSESGVQFWNLGVSFGICTVVSESGRQFRNLVSESGRLWVSESRFSQASAVSESVGSSFGISLVQFRNLAASFGIWFRNLAGWFRNLVSESGAQFRNLRGSFRI